MSKERENSDGAGKIIVKGARTHNLKNITVEMPRNKMIVFTGLSGSGKSSLAFDTIFAEGQRRYVESLSAYARQFLRQMQKPDVDEIIGLSPAISIDQKSRSNNPRSTVATITEVYDYLRVLLSRVGRPYCLICGREIKKLSGEEIKQTILDSVNKILSERKDKKILGIEYNDLKLKLYAPVVVGRKGEYYQMLYDLLGKGYKIVKVDGIEKNLREQIVLEKHKKHDIDALVDEYFLTDLSKSGEVLNERLPEAIERALHESDGLLKIEIPAFASPSSRAVAGRPASASAKHGKRDKNSNEPLESKIISAKFMCPYDGFSYPEIEPRLFSFNSPYGACPECNGLGTRHFFGEESCQKCHGARLRDEALHVRIGAAKTDQPRKASQSGRHRVNKDSDERGLNIVEIANLSIADAYDFFIELELTAKEKEIAKVVLREIESRLQFMVDVGIEYLTLGRRAHTLSGGEAQRIRLASQLGSGLVGALYVLDEPTIGLHAHDNARLIKTLLHLRDIGNTIIVVEHDEETILSSDYLIDIGPGAGVHGGKIVVADYLHKLLKAKSTQASGESLTLAYLRGEKEVKVPEERRTTDKGFLRVRGANLFNIRNQNIDIPLGRFVAVTGVSGSGKSTFVYEILHKNLRARFDRKYRTADVYNVGSFTGTEYLSRTILIDQSAIGRTPRSNPATYTGAWTFIRELLSESEEARVRGWGPSRFSFNVRGGRCEACQGNGEIAVEMHFLPTVYVTCDVCAGKRFMKETLEVRYRKKSVHDILHMTIEEALSLFEDIPAVYDRLKTLSEVGLGYLELGQSATTLSGGEAQRVKISSELYRRHVEKTIYLLDEPTVGLHYEDVKKLIEILQKLVNHGNTVVVIEHNMDIIKSADYIIDFGPDGGNGGGIVIAKGTPEQVAETKKSYTGEYLKKVLRR
ncbi:MAG TPA: excinuclease ABC subunit A [Candidatus Taylorbacteria bacterium]|nr:MAG: Excinuclease ABC, subunit A [Parcubacteria group bacterium GW2011_GWA2_47_64]KKU97151.1 MAG: Excinuclease ABC, subunit A [Parcubacteria group bacterium GW2011_GWC2_48_17]HBV01603.1 excinuclease ABC subunit A [Candidatus Taylorbacteria bacterium]